MTELNHIRDANNAAFLDTLQSGGLDALDIQIITEPVPPTREKHLEHCTQSLSVSLVFFLESAALLLLPRIVWVLRALKHRLWYNYDPEPSAFAEWIIGFYKYDGFIIGCIALVLGAWMYF